MKWPLFENKIKNELSGHRTEVDVQAIWQAIEPEVDALNNRRKKRRAAWIWFTFAGLLLAGVLTGIYLVSDPKESFPDPVKTENMEGGTLPLAEPVPLSETSPMAAEQASGQFENGNASRVHDAGSRIEESAKKDHVVAHVQQDRTQNLSDKGFSGTQTILPDQEITNLEMVQEAGRMPSSGDRHIVPALLPVLEIRPAPSDRVVRDGGVGPLSVFEDFNNAVETEEEAKPDMPLRKKQLHFSAGMIGSVSFTDRQLTARDENFKELNKLRNGTERMLETVQGGLQFGIRHRSGFELTTGLRFTQITERFDYNTSVVTVDSVYGIQALVINLSRDTVPIYGDVPVERQTDFRKRYFNRYRMIDIPVLLGYKFETRRISLGVQTGIMFNLNLSASGRVLATESEDIDIAEEELFRTNAGLSYFLGVSAGYRLSDQWEVYLSPAIRFFPESLTNDDYGLKQTYRLYGLETGLLYHF